MSNLIESVNIQWVMLFELHEEFIHVSRTRSEGFYGCDEIAALVACDDFVLDEVDLKLKEFLSYT